MPTWLEKPQDSQLEEGKPGYLHCLTQATPKPTVIWYRNQMLISEVRTRVAAGGLGATGSSVLISPVHFPPLQPQGEAGGGQAETRTSLVLQDSRFEVFKNGTLRINSVEVYDGTWYRCVSSTPAGSIEAQARVQVLGELAPGPAGRRGPGREPQGPGSSGLPPQALPFLLLKQKSSSSHHHPGHSSAWNLTRRPRCPAQPQAGKSPLLSGSGQVSTLWAWGGGLVTGSPLVRCVPVSGPAECLVLRDRQEM